MKCKTNNANLYQEVKALTALIETMPKGIVHSIEKVEQGRRGVFRINVPIDKAQQWLANLKGDTT